MYSSKLSPQLLASLCFNTIMSKQWPVSYKVEDALQISFSNTLFWRMLGHTTLNQMKSHECSGTWLGSGRWISHCLCDGTGVISMLPFHVVTHRKCYFHSTGSEQSRDPGTRGDLPGAPSAYSNSWGWLGNVGWRLQCFPSSVSQDLSL